ncbi:MAG: hypothetical protein JL50_08415 [Peptococcaceae bacterium BICA1-7]|nr:MAG: hypothetical protein JL50_08415 [Peptococcaceae bacterium BICA1-7]HBV97415.1 hypothetical protein [Desulfotomaculum sp.]
MLLNGVASMLVWRLLEIGIGKIICKYLQIYMVEVVYIKRYVKLLVVLAIYGLVLGFVWGIIADNYSFFFVSLVCGEESTFLGFKRGLFVGIIVAITSFFVGLLVNFSD